ncbi:MAG: EcsC family protein [Reyranella sp.]|nr:EcsC family protein [Reyranella sp.]MBL6652877.1 EcsC family protein [Reyranella sp.]
MTTAAHGLRDLEAAHRTALAAAADTLENPNLAARIADYAGAPVNRVLAMLPRVADRGLAKAAEAAMLRCLKTAIRTLDESRQRRPVPWLSSVAAGVTGGVSGFVGVAALPVELPVTATLMLRAVAAIARHHGEDLSQIEARMACLQVFGLGTRANGVRNDVGYFSARTLLSRMSSGAVADVVQRGALQLSSPLAGSLISELTSRFSLVVSDRIAASAVPVVGAIGGATINVIFMNHFQRIAEAHFTVRRLERHYGHEVVRRHYTVHAAAAQSARR